MVNEKAQHTATREEKQTDKIWVNEENILTALTSYTLQLEQIWHTVQDIA